jgi:hypothetical protein
VGAFVVLFIGTVQKLSKLPHDVIEPSAIKIYSTAYSFAALKADGSITVWGDSFTGGGNTSSAPTDKGYIKI